jgi:hypothetical protein
MKTFWSYGTYRRMDGHRRHVCVLALGTLLALLTLLAVSGPHLVHHLVDLHPREHPHPPDGHPTQQAHPFPRPDCLVLFLMQHTPVAEDGGALLPTLFLAAEPLCSVCPLGYADAPRFVIQARAPPPLSL